MKVSEKISHNTSPSVVAVALVAGTGVVLMICALAVGAIQAAAADSNAIGLAFGGGLILFLIGSVAWFAITQPHKHFDDINQPAPSEHGHGHADHALVVHEETHLSHAGH